MNLRASYRYQLIEQKKSIITYYFILICIMISLFSILLVTLPQDINAKSSMGGMDFATAIFLFILGLNCFKDSFGMLLQNGVSRKSIYQGRILATLTLALLMAFADNILVVIFKTWASRYKNLSSNPIFEQIYSYHVKDFSIFKISIQSFFFDLLLYLAVIAIGFMIGTLYYRMNKAGKVGLSTGLPISLFVVIPIIDTTIAKGRISSSIIKGADYAFGFTRQLPSHAFITFILIFIICSVISWLFVRKAEVRES